MTRLACSSVFRMLCVVLGFTCIGPLFGGLPFMVLLIFSGPDVGVGSSVLGVAFFAYFFGAVPAVLTGIVVGVLAPRLRRRVRYLASALTGLVTAVGFGLWMSGAPVQGGALGAALGNALAFMGVPGLLGGGLSAWTLARLDVVRSAAEAD